MVGPGQGGEGGGGTRAISFVLWRACLAPFARYRTGAKECVQSAAIIKNAGGHRFEF